VKPFRSLHHLKEFAFPQNTDFTNTSNNSDIPWPPNLQRVSLSGSFLPSWPILSPKYIVRHWPLSLRQIILDGISDFNPIYHDPRVFTNTPYQLDLVYVSDRNRPYPSQNMALDCSGVRLLSVPANFADTNYDLYGHPPVLERLEIRRGNKAGPHYFSLSDLVDHAVGIPALQQIRLHSSLVESHEEDAALQVIDALLRSRLQVQMLENETSRIKPDEAGVIIFED
jgi:hypothetical protein